MSRRRTLGLLVPALLAIFALSALAVIAGCGKKGGEEAGAGQVGAEGAEAADVAAEEAAAGGATTAAPLEVAESTEPAGAPTGGRGGRGGGRGRGPGGGMGPAAGGEQAPAPAEETTETTETAEGEEVAEGEEPAQKTGISEVDIAKRVNEFASLYGPLSRVKEKYWNDSTTDWLIFTYTNDSPELTSAQQRLKGRRIKLPLSMAVDAFDLSVLDGYFPIYVATALRPSGEIVSRQEISVPRASMEEYKKEIGESRAVIVAQQKAAAAAAAAAAPEAGVGPAAGGPRGGRGGMRGGRGGRW